LRRMGARAVIGIHLGYAGQTRKDIDNIVEIGDQALDIMAYQITKHRIAQADLVLNPRLYDVGLFDFDRVEECIDAGYKLVMKNLGPIKEAIHKT